MEEIWLETKGGNCDGRIGSKVKSENGLSPDEAQEVVNDVLSHLKEKLPAPLASGLDSYLAGGSTGGGSLADKAKAMASGLGSMFEKKAE